MTEPFRNITFSPFLRECSITRPYPSKPLPCSHSSDVQCNGTVSRVLDAVFIVSCAGVFDIHSVNTYVNGDFTGRMIRCELMGIWRHFH